MTPTGGSHGKLHRTTEILSHAWRRGSLVAARGAGGAGGEAADLGFLGPNAIRLQTNGSPLWRSDCATQFDELEHVPPQLNQGDSRGAEDGEAIGIDSL